MHRRTRLPPSSPVWFVVALIVASVSGAGIVGASESVIEPDVGPAPSVEAATELPPAATTGAADPLVFWPIRLASGSSEATQPAALVASEVGEGSADGPAGRGPRGSGRPVTIAFGGDIHFEGQLATALADDPGSILDPVAELMDGADLAIANLETAVTVRGSPAPKQFTFRTGPDAFVALRAAGIDVVSMANNHGMDYGRQGLVDSLAHAQVAGFDVVGIGLDDAAALAPWSTEVHGQRIAVIGATQVLDSSLIDAWTATADQPGLASAKEVERLVEAVEDARSAHDTVVVFLHWGVEGQTCPAPRQLELADRLIEAGADVIVGGHAHRVQGGGRKDGALVHYGLGNFVFYTEGGPGADSGVLLVTITGRVVDDYRWVPARLQGGVATRLAPDREAAAVEAWDRLRACTDLEP